MSKRWTYHVTPDTDRGWKVKEENSPRALSKHDTKADAINRAKEAAKNQEFGQVVIHKRDMTIQTEHTFGKDTYPHKGQACAKRWMRH